MGFSGIRVLAVGLAYCGFRRFRRSKLGFTQADRERMDQRFDQVEKQMVRMETTQQMFMESTNQRFEQMLNMIWTSALQNSVRTSTSALSKRINALQK